MGIFSRVRRMLPALSLALAAPAWAAAPPLQAYGNLPEIEDAAISPNGSGLAVVARMEGQRMLLVFDAQHNIRSRAALDDLKLRQLEWVGDDRVLVVKSSTQALGSNFTASKFEFFSAVVVPSDGSKAQAVFDGKPGMMQAVFGVYGSRRVAGKWQLLVGGVEYARGRATGSQLAAYDFTSGRPALFSVGAADNSARRVAPPAAENHWRDWLVDGAGQAAVTLDVDSKTGRWTISDSQDKALVNGVDPLGDVSLVALGKDGTTAIYRVKTEAGDRTWFEVPLAGGTPSEFLPGLGVEKIIVDPDSGRMLGYLPKGSDAKPTLFDPARQALLHKVYRAFPKLHVDLLDWTPSFSHAVIRTSGNGDSGSWYLVELDKPRAFQIGAERPAIPAAEVGAISTVSYTASDGLALDGILTLPPGKPAKGLPIMLFPHGGPHSHDKAEFDWWAQAFASRGYAVFQPNFRGSTNRDDAFLRAGFGQWGRKMQSDVSDGLAELAKRGIVDPKRACIVGASYGGYAALAGVTLQRGLYRCAVAVAPVSDLADMYWTNYRDSGEDEMVQRTLRERLGDPAGYAAVSPRRHAAQADAPILLIHGKDDTVVPFAQSTAMATALKAAGKPYEFVVLREEDHWLSRAATRQQMLDAAMRFVTQHNPAD